MINSLNVMKHSHNKTRSWKKTTSMSVLCGAFSFCNPWNNQKKRVSVPPPSEPNQTESVCFRFLLWEKGSCGEFCSLIAADRLFGLNISHFFYLPSIFLCLLALTARLHRPHTVFFPAASFHTPIPPHPNKTHPFPSALNFPSIDSSVTLAVLLRESAEEKQPIAPEEAMRNCFITFVNQRPDYKDNRWTGNKDFIYFLLNINPVAKYEFTLSSGSLH